MEYGVIVFALLALGHFVYEGIVAPTWLLHERFKLFALRDELRRLKIARRDGLAAKHFDYLQGAINGLIHNAERIDATMLVALQRRAKRDPQFLAKVEARAKT